MLKTIKFNGVKKTLIGHILEHQAAAAGSKPSDNEVAEEDDKPKELVFLLKSSDSKAPKP
jgi:hypothetical protein